MKRLIPALLLTAAVVSRSVLLAQQPPKIIGELSVATITGEAGIRPLTDVSLAEAIQLGESDGGGEKIGELSSPLMALVQSKPMAEIYKDVELSQRLELLLKGPYSITVRSPYASAGMSAAAAKRRYEKTPVLSATTLNADKVVVHVSTGSDFTNIGTIENVVIKRGGDIIRPLKAVVTPTTVQNRMGATAVTAEGAFTFDFSVFEPTAPITLVLIGKSANFEWMMPASELAALR